MFVLKEILLFGEDVENPNEPALLSNTSSPRRYTVANSDLSKFRKLIQCTVIFHFKAQNNTYLILK